MRLSEELKEVNKLLAAQRVTQAFQTKGFPGSPANLFREIVLKKNVRAVGGMPHPAKRSMLGAERVFEEFMELNMQNDRLRSARRPMKRMTPEDLLDEFRKTYKDIPTRKSAHKAALKPMMSPEEYFEKVLKENEKLEDKADKEKELEKPKKIKAIKNSPWYLFQKLLETDTFYEIEDVFRDDYESEPEEDDETFLRKEKQKESDFEQAVLAGKLPVAPHILHQKLIPQLNSDLGNLQTDVKEILENAEKYGLHQKLQNQFQKCNKVGSFNLFAELKSLAFTTEYADTQSDGSFHGSKGSSPRGNAEDSGLQIKEFESFEDLSEIFE